MVPDRNLERGCDTCKYADTDMGDDPCYHCGTMDLHDAWEQALPEPPAASIPAPAEGRKNDTGKPRYDLLSPEALEGLARLCGMGAGKYEDRNWEKGMDWSRIFAAMERHAWRWFRGERHDDKDGQHHLLSVMWCAMALYTYEARRVGTDNRPGIPHFNPAFWSNQHDKPVTAAQ